MKNNKTTILSISDWIEPVIYSEKMKERMNDVDLIVSCGDIPANYLDFVMSELNKPLFFVEGNHVNNKNYNKNMTGKTKVNMPDCFKNAHLTMYKEEGLLITGFEGSIWYNGGPFQYRQWEVHLLLLKLVPKLLLNKLIHGRYLDIFVSHSPPWKVGDRDDPCHRGLKAFNWFIKLFKPKVFLHGHVHLYDRNESRVIQYHDTTVINCSGYSKVIVDHETEEVYV